MGKTKDADGKFDGSLLGARLAYRSPVMFWAGLDVALGVSGTFKPDSGANQDGKRTTVGLVAGLDLPVLLRAWVGYGFYNHIKFDDTTAEGQQLQTWCRIHGFAVRFIELGICE